MFSHYPVIANSQRHKQCKRFYKGTKPAIGTSTRIDIKKHFYIRPMVSIVHLGALMSFADKLHVSQPRQ